MHARDRGARALQQGCIAVKPRFQHVDLQHAQDVSREPVRRIGIDRVEIQRLGKAKAAQTQIRQRLKRLECEVQAQQGGVARHQELGAVAAVGAQTNPRTNIGFEIGGHRRKTGHRLLHARCIAHIDAAMGEHHLAVMKGIQRKH